MHADHEILCDFYEQVQVIFTCKLVMRHSLHAAVAARARVQLMQNGQESTHTSPGGIVRTILVIVCTILVIYLHQEKGKEIEGNNAHDTSRVCAQLAILQSIKQGESKKKKGQLSWECNVARVCGRQAMVSLSPDGQIHSYFV